MTIRSRAVLGILAVACAAAVVACGGASAPTAPSPSGGAGATIAGNVMSPPAGLTVAVAGTNLSTPVESSGDFQLSSVPSGNVQLRFTSSSVSATAQIANVGQEELIQIQVQMNGATATIVNEVRSAKVVLCHRTESGTYHSIDVSVNAEQTHRDHGDGKVGDPVPGRTNMVFGQDCQPSGASIQIKKSTNGEDADEAPGPRITIGSPITWRYVVTNDGTVNLTNVSVTDDRGVAVNCGGQTTLAAGQSMTCTGTGVATAGQYRNVGSATAASTLGPVTDSDPSHYLGVAPDDDEEEGPKVQLCHRTGNGSYHLIEVSVNAEPAHRAHGDGKIGEAVPGNAGRVFGAGCSVQ